MSEKQIDDSNDSIDILWSEIRRADAACDAEHIGRLLPLLIARDDRVESLAHIERLFRSQNYNARLIACSMSTMNGINKFSSLDPRRPSVELPFYVSVNAEGEESADTETKSHCQDSTNTNNTKQQRVSANLARLANECGFLVLEQAASLIDSQTHTIQFGNFEQFKRFKSIFEAQQSIAFSGQIPRCCATCYRLGNGAVELRSLPCCTSESCCSTQCFERHVQALHTDSENC